jgi:hypothetical protein
MIIAFAIPVAAMLFALVFIFLKKANVVNNAEEFPYATYLDSPRALDGNNYLIKAQIDSQLAYNQSAGKMVSVRTPSGARFAVFVPEGRGTNMQVGQKYNLYVNIDQNGVIIVNGMEKF